MLGDIKKILWAAADKLSASMGAAEYKALVLGLIFLKCVSDICTTNAIESVNMRLRKLTRNRGSFPSDEAWMKLFYLALRNISQKWNMPTRDWKGVLNRFTIQFEERFPQLQPKLRSRKKSDTP